MKIEKNNKENLSTTRNDSLSNNSQLNNTISTIKIRKEDFITNDKYKYIYNIAKNLTCYYMIKPYLTVKLTSP